MKQEGAAQSEAEGHSEAKDASNVAFCTASNVRQAQSGSLPWNLESSRAHSKNAAAETTKSKIVRRRFESCVDRFFLGDCLRI